MQIFERDLGARVPDTAGTDIFVTGFSPKGPVDEVVTVSTLQEHEAIFGNPTNPAERYFYYSCEQLYDSGARVHLSRLPYGEQAGTGFGTLYGALVYPAKVISTVDASAGPGTNFSAASATYILGKPKYFNLTRSEYVSAVDGTGFDWSATASTPTALNAVSAFGGAAVIVLNKAQTTINDRFEGYYVGLVDNTNINPATDFDGILRSESLTVSAGPGGSQSYTTISNNRQGFTLSGQQSISEVMENLSDFDISSNQYSDVLSLGVFKMNQSTFANDAIELGINVRDRLAGSIDFHRQVGDQSGGLPQSFFLENLADNNSVDVSILINDNISNRLGSSSLNNDGTPTKKIRVASQAMNDLLTSDQYTLSGEIGFTLTQFNSAWTSTDYADSLFPVGAYSNLTLKSKTLGSIPAKIDRVLTLVDNDEVFDIDITVEAGLGTIYAAASANEATFYNDETTGDGLITGLNALATSQNYSVPNNSQYDLRGNYNTIFSRFQEFAETTRKDHLFIADPLRHILIRGRNSKVIEDPNKNWSLDVFSPMRHQFSLANTSFAATYGNWARVNDKFSGANVWVPFSGYVAAMMARSDRETFPWLAPAGFQRGRIFGVDDVAVEPNQRQRDDLYKFNINPLTLFPREGLVVFGQKTLQKQLGAFDRINVRRLFLVLEKATKQISRQYVFEPNTLFTRTRIKDDLRPLFEQARQNDGLYDYLIVADERNNTPDVIDRNELVVDIYIKPVQAAEFILVSFVAVRTGTDFTELVGPQQ